MTVNNISFLSNIIYCVNNAPSQLKSDHFIKNISISNNHYNIGTLTMKGNVCGVTDGLAQGI